jgi:small subunit ribosomal protein S18
VSERAERGERGDRGDRERGDRERGEREHRDRGDRDRGDRDRGDRDYRDRDYRERGPQSVKSRLRAKARKKARKQRKRGGFQRRRPCRFCVDKNVPDYRDMKTLRPFISETGKMVPRRVSGNCAKHQRALALEVKRARHLAYLPYQTAQF